MACTSPVYANYLLQQHHRRRRQLECLKAFSGERRAQNGNGNGRVSMSGRGRRKERQKLEIRAGLPVVSSVPVVGPVLNFVINPTVLTAIYVFGAPCPPLHGIHENCSIHSMMSRKLTDAACPFYHVEVHVDGHLLKLDNGGHDRLEFNGCGLEQQAAACRGKEGWAYARGKGENAASSYSVLIRILTDNLL